MRTRVPSGPPALTERQVEVLRLLERGLTNFEIAQELGVSLEGAKYHVREILARLNVESREDAVAAWRQEQRPWRRIGRLVGGLLPGQLGTAVVVGVMVVAAGVALAVFALGRDGNDAATGDPPPDSTPQATLTPVAASPTQGRAPTATRVPSTGGPPVTVTGLFLGEPPVPASTPVGRELGDRPDSPFPPQESYRIILYDTVALTLLDLGEGEQPAFSPNSEWIGFIDTAATGSVKMPGAATAYHIPSGRRQTFVDGTAVTFVDDDRICVWNNDSCKFYDLATGALAANQVPSNGYPVRTWLEHRPGPPGQFWEILDDQVDRGSSGFLNRRHFVLRDAATDAVVLEFDALQVEPAGEHEVIVATETEDDAGLDDPGRTNLFLLDLRTGSAQFVDRIERGRGLPIPLSATETHVLWTEKSCMLDAEIRIFDRATGEHTVVQDDLDIFDRRAYLAPGGRFAFGAVGSRALVDIATMEYALVLPDIQIANQGDFGRAVWSADYRYASYRRGGPGGGGGVCGN